MPYSDPEKKREYFRKHDALRNATPERQQQRRKWRTSKEANARTRKRHKKRLADPAYRERKRKTALATYYRMTPEKRHAARLREHGLTPATYASMLSAQDGLCGICREPPSQTKTFGHRAGLLCVDHNHATGRVRGLLCGFCNAGLGHFRDSPERLNSAVAYLASH